MSSLSLVLVFLLLRPTSASKTFKPNCTLPANTVNFVSAPNVRGTLDILWSCLFTLLICTWTVQHLNIPEQKIRDGEPTIKETLVDKLENFWRKAKWMLATLILPEFLVGKAFQDWVLAKRSCQEMSAFATDDGVKWTITHGFYANMGGFVLKAKRRYVQPGSAEPEFQKAYVYLNARRLFLARGGSKPAGESEEPGSQSMIDKLPLITREEIEDKSKGDIFVKATALVQCVWLLIQVCVRAGRHFVVSQFEIAVLAYIACTMITYRFCWSKPQDVQVPTVVRTTSPVSIDNFSGEKSWPLAGERPRSWFGTSLRLFRFEQFGLLRSKHGSSAEADVFRPPPNDGRYDEATSILLPKGALLTLLDDGFTFAGVIFGAVHCAAWNFAFPTPVERLLWRIASVVTAGVLPVYYVVLLSDLHGRWPRVFKSSLWLLECVFALSYVISRLYLLVEVFRSLCFLPPEAFRTTWSTQVPHVS